MKKTTSPSYKSVTTTLKKSLPNSHVAQIHGLICGYICAAGEPVEKWDTLLLGEKKDKKIHELFRKLYEKSYQQLSEFSFEFNLMLPDDKNDINVRAEALGLWCQGFLTSLEKSGIPIRQRPPSEVTEALDDIMQIGQISFGDIANSEADEMAFIELVEYVRLSVVMLFAALKETQHDQIGRIH